MSRKSSVALTHGLDMQENVTRVFNIMDGATKMTEPDSTTMLKPNAGHAAPPEFTVCTRPGTVRAAVHEVRKASPKRIITAKAAAVGCDTDECYEACGIAVVTREEGVELVDIKRDKDLISIAVRGYRSNVSHVRPLRLLLEAEHIINLSILRAHASMVSSGALKNIKGVMQDRVCVQMHQRNPTMAMMDVWQACRTDISIMDVMYAVSGYSPRILVPIEVDCIVGSCDSAALNRIARELIGIDPDGVDCSHVAQKAGLDTTNCDDIEVVGDKVADHYRKMWVPYLEDVRNRRPEYEVHCEGACSSCQTLLTLSMEALKAIDVCGDNTDMVVVTGGQNTLSPDTSDGKILLYDNCTRKHLEGHPNAFFLQGCLPGEGSLCMSVLYKEAMTGKPEQMHWIRERMEIDTPVWCSYVEKEAEKFYGSDDK